MEMIQKELLFVVKGRRGFDDLDVENDAVRCYGTRQTMRYRFT